MELQEMIDLAIARPSVILDQRELEGERDLDMEEFLKRVRESLSGGLDPFV